MPITVKHSKVSTIPDDADTNLVRPSDWNADHTLVGLGTMAEQNANAVAITGGTINGTTIGATTEVAGSFTDLSVTGTTSFDGSQGTSGQVLTSSGAGNTPTWATPSGSGTVTSITAGSGLSGGTITTSGTIALDINGLSSTTVVANDLLPVYDVSASANADCLASDIAGLGVGAIGYANSRYYFPYLMVGAGTVLALTANRIYYLPFFVRKKTTFTRIGIQVTINIGTSAALGIYNSSNGVPTSLLLDCGTVSTASTGEKEITISQSLNTGFYFLALVADSNPSVYNLAGTTTSSGYAIGQSTRTGAVYTYFASLASIALPSSASGLSDSQTQIPAVSLRVV